MLHPDPPLRPPPPLQALHGVGVVPVGVLLAYELAGAGQRTVFVCIAFTTAHCVRVLVALALTSPAATAQPAVPFFVSTALQASFMVNGRRQGEATARPTARPHSPVAHSLPAATQLCLLSGD